MSKIEIRVSEEEKKELQSIAKRLEFKSLSDYIRQMSFMGTIYENENSTKALVDRKEFSAWYGDFCEELTLVEDDKVKKQLFDKLEVLECLM